MFGNGIKDGSTTSIKKGGIVITATEGNLTYSLSDTPIDRIDNTEVKTGAVIITVTGGDTNHM